MADTDDVDYNSDEYPGVGKITKISCTVHSTHHWV